MKNIIGGIAMLAMMFCFFNCGGGDLKKYNDKFDEQTLREIEAGRNVDPLIEETPYCEE